MNVYTLNVTYPTTQITTLVKDNMKALVISLLYNDEAIELWHRRMGYLNKADLKRLVGISKGISLLIKPRIRLICDACLIGKSRRKLSGKVQQKVTQKLARIYTDLGGPINVPGLGGAQFYMLLTDKATSHTWCYAFKYKDDAYENFTAWKTMVENQSSSKVKIVRLDNSGEYINDRFKRLFTDSGIV